MINFTVGPVQMDEETLRLGCKQIPYFRTEEFSELMAENERMMLSLADAENNSRAVFLTASGTGAMEAAIVNSFDRRDKVLVVNGGSFGARFVEILKIHEIPFEEIHLDYGKPLTKEILSNYDPANFSGFVIQLCETSTGVLYDVDLVSEFCSKNKIFLLVDAISGFLADEISMRRFGIDILITGSQKALALPPGISIIMMSKRAVSVAQECRAKCLYLNLFSALKDGERGQTPFTPAVGILIQLNEKLKRIGQSGGYFAQRKIIERRAKRFRSYIKDFQFEFFVELENMSNCVTALSPSDKKLSAYKIFEILKNEYGIWICPNGGELKETVLRVGHIGAISDGDMDALFCALQNMKSRGILE